MAATVVTFSPHVSLRDAERMARARVERDGVATLAATTSDGRQVRQLRRLARRLAADDNLDCYLADHGNGATLLTVFPRSAQETRRGVGWWGEPRIG